MPWLNRGSQGDAVEGIQALLSHTGLYGGSIDGSYGPQTEAAVRKWQTHVGALPDGKWGARTMDATANELAFVNSQAALDVGLDPVVTPVVAQPGSFLKGGQ